MPLVPFQLLHLGAPGRFTCRIATGIGVVNAF
jgi:hypothetical protein